MKYILCIPWREIPADVVKGTLHEQVIIWELFKMKINCLWSGFYSVPRYLVATMWNELKSQNKGYAAILVWFQSYWVFWIASKIQVIVLNVSCCQFDVLNISQAWSISEPQRSYISLR